MMGDGVSRLLGFLEAEEKGGLLWNHTDNLATIISPKFVYVLEHKYCTKNALLTACAGKATPL